MEFPGQIPTDNNYDRNSSGNIDECQDKCLSDERCWSVHYVKSLKYCNLYWEVVVTQKGTVDSNTVFIKLTKSEWNFTSVLNR